VSPVQLVYCVMAKEGRSTHSFDDVGEEHDSFDVELGESSHDDQNFDAELAETDQTDPLASNDDSTVDDPVCCYCYCCKSLGENKLNTFVSITVFRTVTSMHVWYTVCCMAVPLVCFSVHVADE